MPPPIRKRLAVPVKGQYDGPDPTALIEGASPFLRNIRIVNSRFGTRTGNSRLAAVEASGAAVGDSPTHTLHFLYKEDGTRFMLAGRGNGPSAGPTKLYYTRRNIAGGGTDDTDWMAASGGSGYAAATNNGSTNSALASTAYQGEVTEDQFYFTSGTGKLQRFDLGTNTLYNVAAPTAPSTHDVPQIQRRVQSILEPWNDLTTAEGDPGTDGLPPHWNGVNSTTQFSDTKVLSIADASTAFPHPPVGNKRRAVVTFETAGSDGDLPYRSDYSQDVTATNFVGFMGWQTVNSGIYLSAHVGQGSDQNDIQTHVNLDFDAVAKWQVFLVPIGDLQSLSYVGFEVGRDATGSDMAVYLSKFFLCGNLDGEYRWLYTFYDSTTGRESPPSRDMLSQGTIDFTLKNTEPASLKKTALIGIKGQAYGTGTDYVRVYRTGGVPSLSVDENGNAVWTLIPNEADDDKGVVNFSTTLTTNYSSGVALIHVAEGRGVPASSTSAVQVTATDLVIDAATNTKVTSASHSFITDDVGKTVAVSSGTGFNVASYTILSVSSGAAILSASAGTLSSTGGHYTLSTGTGTSNWIILSFGSGLAREFCQVKSVVFDSGSTGAATVTLWAATIHGHSNGAAVNPAWQDNNADDALAGRLTLDTERSDPPQNVQWLARVGERLWLFLNSLVYVSNKPTPDRKFDMEDFPNVDPYTRQDPLQGFTFACPANSGGDRMMWGGTRQGMPTVITRKTVYEVRAYAQQDWGPTAVPPVVHGVGCIAGRTVASLDGLLIWATDGPRIVAWDGVGRPRPISHQRIAAALEAAPVSGWPQWHAHTHSTPDGHYYSLFIVSADDIDYPDLRLDYNFEEDVWEPLTYVDADGVALEWRGAAVQDGPGDGGALVGFRSASQILYRFDDPASLTDYLDAGDTEVAVKVSWKTRKEALGEPGLVSLVREVILRLEGKADVGLVTVRTGGSDYGEIVFDCLEADLCGDGDTEVRVPVPHGAFGSWLQVELTGDMSLGPAVRELEALIVPWRLGRVSGVVTGTKR